MSGFFGVSEQAAQVLMLNICTVMYQIPYGMQCAATSIIGAKLRAGQVKESMYYYRAIMTLSFFWDISQFCLLFFLQDYLIGIYTSSEEIKKCSKEVVWLITAVIALDFCQGVLYGTIKALQK